MLRTRDIMEFTEKQANIHCITNFVHKGFNCYIIDTEDGEHLLVYGNERLIKYQLAFNYPYAKADTLDALGLAEDTLTDNQKAILKEEFDKICYQG